MLNADTDHSKFPRNRPVRLFLLKTQDDEEDLSAQDEASGLGGGRVNNKSTTIGSSISKSESASFEKHYC